MELMANCRMRVETFSAWGWLREVGNRHGIVRMRSCCYLLGLRSWRRIRNDASNIRLGTLGFRALSGAKWNL